MTREETLLRTDAPLPGDVPKQKKMRKADRTRTLFILSFLIWPALQLFVFYFVVNAQSIIMAFQRSVPGTTVRYWTLDNFRRIIVEGFQGGEPLLKEATINTLTFFSFNFFIMTPVNIMVGYFFYKKMPLYKVYRFIFYLPAVIPATVLATLFKYIIAPDSSGLISSLLANIGVQLPNLLGSSEYAMKTLIVYSAWTGVTGFLLTSNAMNRVPTEIVESARLDGVTPVQEVVRILVPLIWPTIATSLLLSVMNIFTSSGPILLFTQGNHGTYTVAYWLFEKVMTNTNMEYAAAVGIFYTLLGFPFLLVTRWLSKRVEEVEY